MLLSSLRTRRVRNTLQECYRYKVAKVFLLNLLLFEFFIRTFASQNTNHLLYKS